MKYSAAIFMVAAYQARFFSKKQVPKMKLVDNWRGVLKHAAGVKFMALSLLIIALGTDR